MKFDIIIIGGGMVGAALACALRNTSLRIALIDATSATPSNDPRLIALNDSSCSLLKNLDVWPQLANHSETIAEVHASFRGQFGSTRILAKEIGLASLGSVVPAKYINAALYDTLTQIKNVEIIRPAILKNFLQLDTHVSVDIEIHSEVKTLETKILIGADGTQSTVRKLLEIPTEFFDYHQSAIVTETTLQRSHHNIAYERFHDTGAIAMLPLSENLTATIWSDSNANVAQLMQLDDADFLNHLQKIFGYRLGKLKSIGKRYTYPLQMTRAKQQIKQRVILIGNAAHTLHPIAAQGLNLALHEVAVIAENFAQQKSENLSLQNLLNNTQEQASVRLSHYLPKLFTSDFFIVKLSRQLGMIGLDICSIAKRRFAKHALGRAGHIPTLILNAEQK